MESEKSSWSKAKERISQNKKILYIAVSAVLVAGILAALLVFRKHREELRFYPINSFHKLQPVYKMFSRKEYLNLTSYVDSLVTSLHGENKKIALFYKAESYFLQGKLGEAWQIFFVIDRLYPRFWQAEFRKGCIYVLQEQYEKSEAILSAIQKPLPIVYFWKGRLYEGLKEWDRAVEYYQKDLSNPEAIFRAAKILEAGNKREKALSYFFMLYDKYPEYRNEAIRNLVRIYEAKKEYGKMLKYLEQWEKVEPHNILVQKKEGIAYYHLGKHKEAYRILSTSILHQRDPEILRILGKISFRLGKYANTIQYLDQVGMNSQEKQLYIQALMKLEQYGRAKLLLTEYLEREKIEDRSQVAQFYRWLIETNLQLGNSEQALKYAMLLVQTEETAENYVTLAQVYQYSKNPAGYIASMKKASEMEPKYVPVLLKKLIELEDHRQALNIIEKILKKSPYHEPALFYRAKIEIQEKRWDDAKISLYTLVYLPPKDQEIYEKSLYYLASIRLYDGKVGEAKSLLQKGLEISPNSIEINFRMAQVLIREKKFREAGDVLMRLKSQDKLSDSLRIKIYDLLAFTEGELKNFEKSEYYAARSRELKVGRTR
jgi:tetratricopeptide (TPR) repeat protein